MAAGNAEAGAVLRRQLVCAAAKRAASSERRRKTLIDDSVAAARNEDGDEEGEEEYVRPVLPGDEPDFWDGPQWNILGFIVQYLWAIGIVVALIGCTVAVRFYNEGASNFKETEVFKEAMEAQGVLEAPSDSKVFEESPPKDAPAVVQENPS